MDKNIGRKLDGRYEITELIGIGGMADVYRAIDIVENKIVAVKILKNEFANDDDFLRRFRNESKAIAVLSHPNIVKIFDVGFTDKIQFIVMEYIDGITLKEFMEQQSILKWKDAIHFIIQILRALQHAHDRGIVHRDIKPQNIMLFPDGTIKVMDFGIARFAREEGKTLSDKAIGSVHYISPEQARGDIVDEKSDIYSVGVMMYEMLTGIKPFDANNPVSVALMQMQAKAKPPRELNENIPEGLEEIVIRAMQKEPSRRYQSASEMIKDIEEFKRNPSIIFEYKYLTPPVTAGGDTRYFKPVKQSQNTALRPRPEQQIQQFRREQPPYPSQQNNNRKNGKYDAPDPYYDDEEDEGSGKSMFVLVLTAIAAAVVIIAAFFIVTVVINNLNHTGKNQTITMPNLVGMNYDVAKQQYSSSFKLEIEYTEYSQYEYNTIYWQSRDPDSAIKTGTTITVRVSKGIKDVQIPDVSNMESSAAIALLQDTYGLIVNTTRMVDDNIVENFAIKTDPPKGESVAPGSTITLYVSLGPEIADIVVPNFVGESQEGALRLAIENNLDKQLQFTQEDSKEPKGTVLNQSVEPDKIIKQDEIIYLTVSSGNPPVNYYYLPISIPESANGSYEFKSYIGGQENNSQSVDNVAYTNGVVTLKVHGSELQTITVEIRNVTTGQSAQLAMYEFNFDDGKYRQISYDATAFERTSGGAQSSTDARDVGENGTPADDFGDDENND